MSETPTYKIPRKNALPKCHPHQTIYVTSHITSNTTWSPNHSYILMNEVHVKSGATLTILPGTIIYANALEVSNASSLPALVVETTGKLIANGTPEHPITFTSILPLDTIFHVAPTTKTYTYGGGLGPFAEFWNGITVCGEGFNNAGPQPTLTLYGVPYGGSNPNTYQFEMTHTHIYFAGITRLGTNSLTLGAPGYYDKFNHNEILFGQGTKLAVYGGSLLAHHCALGFTNGLTVVDLRDGAQVYLIQNLLFGGLENINANYYDPITSTTQSLLIVQTPQDSLSIPLQRRSIAFANNNTFLSLTYRQNHVKIVEEGRAFLVNQAYVGNCQTVLQLSEVTDSLPTPNPLTISTSLPAPLSPPSLPLEQNYIWLGPSAYEHISGTYYAGPTPLTTLPEASSNLYEKIHFLFYTTNQSLLLRGHFLDLHPKKDSDLFSNSEDPVKNHLISFLDPLYFSLLTSPSPTLNPFQNPYYASGATELPQTGFTGHLLISPSSLDVYWRCFLQEDKESSSSDSESSSSSCSSSSSSSGTKTSTCSTLSTLTDRIKKKSKKSSKEVPPKKDPYNLFGSKGSKRLQGVDKYLLPGLLMLGTLSILHNDD